MLDKKSPNTESFYASGGIASAKHLVYIIYLNCYLIYEVTYWI